MKILFICTHNACRSILAEAIMRHLSRSRIEAASAESSPAGQVHPLTLQFLEAHGYSPQGLSSKDFEAVSGFLPEAVITVCDQAVCDVMPDRFGHPAWVHWGLEDPSRNNGSQQENSDAFSATIKTLERRVGKLFDSYTKTMDKVSLGKILVELDAVF